METDLNSQDRKDLDKFIKFFALKTVQVIVQARLGEKICTRSSSSPTGSDWVKFSFFVKGYAMVFVTRNHSAVVTNTIFVLLSHNIKICNSI
uniref:Autophagy related 13 n=1 Tax=Suricata suricatta TaxID=37032 RepID=A0A673TQD0_SURSU